MILQREVALQKYLPPTVEEFVEFEEITKSESIELNKIRLYLLKIFKNRFVHDADEWGIRRWEEMLKIKRKSTDTLEQRRLRILVKLNDRLPYTFRTLIKKMNALCGQGNYEIVLRANEYEIDFQFFDWIADMDLVSKTLDEMIPVNMAINEYLAIKPPIFVLIIKKYNYNVRYPVTGGFRTESKGGYAARKNNTTEGCIYNYSVGYPITGTIRMGEWRV